MQQLTKTKSQFEPNIAYYVGMDILFDSIGYIVCVCVCGWDNNDDQQLKVVNKVLFFNTLSTFEALV